MSGDLPMVKSAATGLVGRLRTTDRAIVVDIKDYTSIAQELTSDRDSIARAIRGLSANTAQVETHMCDRKPPPSGVHSRSRQLGG
jgi:hypothetical protein